MFREICPKLVIFWSQCMDPKRLRPIHDITDTIGLTDAVRRNLHEFMSALSDYSAEHFNAQCEVISDYDVINNQNWRARPVIKASVVHNDIEGLLSAIEFHNRISLQRDTDFEVLKDWSLCAIRNKVNFPPVTQYRAFELKIRHNDTGQIAVISHVMAHSQNAHESSAKCLEEYRVKKATLERTSEQHIDLTLDVQSDVRDQSLRFLDRECRRLEEETASAITQCALINYSDACTNIAGRSLNDLVTEFERTSYYRLDKLISDARVAVPTPFRQVA